MTKLTIKEAAAHFNVSERTIRRWVAAGQLQVERVAMAHGVQVFILPDATGDVTPDVTGDNRADTPPETPNAQYGQPVEVLLPVAQAQPAAGHSDVQTLLMLLDQRDKRIEELAERVGRYAERVEHLEQEVERLRQATPQPVEPKRVPWWRKWLGPI